MTATAAAASGGYLDLLRRNRNFRLLYVGGVVSLAGDWFLTVALLDLVLDLTGSGLLAALLIVGQTLPSFILAPYAGTVVDRVDRRRLMIGVNLFCMVAALTPLLARTPATLPFAYLGVIGISIGATFFAPASQAALPNVVDDRDLARANILMGSTWGTMLAAGAALGGLATSALGRETAIVINAVSFGVSALLLWRVTARFQQVRPAEHVRLLTALRQAAGYAAAHRRVLALLSCKAGYGIAAGAVALLSVFGNEVFGLGALGIGLLYAARGGGALLGPILIRRIGGGDERMFSLIGAACVFQGVGYIVFAVVPAFGFAVLAIFIAHLGGGALWTASSYGLQRSVPDELRGRIFAADFGFFTLTVSLASIAAGFLSDHVGPTPTAMLLGGAGVLWGVAWTLWTRPLWRPGAALTAPAEARSQ